MKVKSLEGIEKAASIYKQLGEDLPMEVFDHLTSEEIERLILKLGNQPKLPDSQETGILKEFVDSLKNPQSPIANKNPSKIQDSKNPSKRNPKIQQEEWDEFSGSPNVILEELEKLLREESNTNSESISNISLLEDLDPATVSQLTVDETADIIAQILFFSPEDTASYVIQYLPISLREEVILEMGSLDFHSQKLRDNLDRFLAFKLSLITSSQPQNLQKLPGRQGKKAASILNQLNPGESKEILSKIQKKRPKFAENIIEHYYSFQDLLLLGRKSLSDFLSGFHPLILATAFKGIEIPLKEEILSSVEPWVAKEIRLECDSLGSVSLGEIEESHRGILDQLREDIERGRLKLWRFR